MQTYHIKKILEVLVYIETHIDEPLLLSKLSAIARISPYYFHRLFKAYLSMTPKEYIQRIRMTQSAKRLQYSQVPITEIAFDAGYEELSSFARVFLQSTKKSPRAYRKERQENLARMQSIKTIKKPEYIERKEERVCFLRKVGDYRETVALGIRECIERFPKMKSCIGMALDDPLTIPRKECRFDFCVSPQYVSLGEWGQKTLAPGRYAVFIHSGPFSSLEEVFTQSFYDLCKKESLRFSGSFCQYLDLPKASEFSLNVSITAKYFVPLAE